MNQREQTAMKIKLRRVLEELLDSDLRQVDIEEDEEPSSTIGWDDRRLTLIARYEVPAKGN